jgi:hypothetical protein
VTLLRRARLPSSPGESIENNRAPWRVVSGGRKPLPRKAQRRRQSLRNLLILHFGDKLRPFSPQRGAVSSRSSAGACGGGRTSGARGKNVAGGADFFWEVGRWECWRGAQKNLRLCRVDAFENPLFSVGCRTPGLRIPLRRWACMHRTNLALGPLRVLHRFVKSAVRSRTLQRFCRPKIGVTL